MKAVVVHDFDNIQVEERPVPVIGPEEILVQTKVSGICSGDIMPWYIKKKAPLVLGHEPAGLVAQVGRGVTGFAVGDRVFVHHHAPCFQCPHCMRENFSMCDTWRRSSIEPGGMAEYFRVPAENLADTLILPAEVSLEAGALVEPVACGIKAIRRAKVRQGDKVLVIGLGVMGQILVKLAKLSGAATVIASDFIAERRHLAQTNGADRVVDPQTVDLPGVVQESEGRKADVVIVGPPSIAAMQHGLKCVESGGTLLLFTPTAPGEQLCLEPFDIYFNEISLVPSYSCGPQDTRAALKYFQTGHLMPGNFITRSYAVEEAPQAFRAMARGEVIKAVVKF